MLMNPLFLAMMVQQQQLQQQQPQTHGLPSNPPGQQQMNPAAQMQQQQLLAMLGQLGHNPGNQASLMQALQQQPTPQPNMPNFLPALQSTAPQQQPIGGLPDFNQIQPSQTNLNLVHDPRLALQSTAAQQQAQLPTQHPEQQSMPSQQPKAADQVPASSQGQLQALAAMLMQKSQK